ncbi:MAG TPA: leucine-rich repeat domain-containing protein, partial [Candidatus Hydrogenedentes bacterium]|nr:leucine-rich repeat domain-containing protein [Candidatus Hydrogenedentota bacterium]
GHLNLANNQIQDASPLAGLTHLNELNLRYNLLTTMTAFPGGAVFTEADGTPYLYLEQNPLLPEVCDTQIPALETRGVVVEHDACTGPVFVPDVTGSARSEAEIALEDAGLVTGNVAEVFSNTVPAGFVISQDPAAGTPVTPAYNVDLVVSLGPEVAQLVNVPDPNLAAAIRQELSLPGGTPLTTAHLASLYWLNAVYEGIADLTGLEFAVNLRWLDLGANPIADVSPLAGAVSLESLGLYECALTDITPLAGLANLVDVNLRDNAITDITPLAGMTRIIALYLNDNALADIGPLSGLTGLIVLYLTNNHIQDVAPLASLAAMNELSLGGNHITSVAALASGTVSSNASSPTPYVELYNDPLLPAACDTEIPALEARGVTVYHDACTGAVYVPDVTGDSQASATYDLAAAGLGVGTVTQVFSDTVPAGFVAGQHPAAGIPVVPGYSVDLTVSQGPEAGQLVNVPDTALAEAIRSQLGLVTGTPLTTAHMAALTYLGAGWIGVADLTGLEYAVNLTQLYIGGSAFTDLSPLAGLTGLFDLALDSNAITDISPLAGLAHLNTLYLGTCDITDVSPLAGLTTLTYLDLNYNEVADVSPLSGLVNLYLLGLSHNRLTDVSPLAGLTKLQNLVVSANFLTTLAPLVAGTAFTEGAPAELYAYDNPLLPEVCDTQIPQIEARGVTVYRNDCEGPVYMPDVTGDTLTGAAAEIQAAEISLSVVTEAFSATVPAGFVISQFPAAGTPVIPWYPASVTVSTGPEGGQLVNVPDANLAAVIRTELGLDPGTPLTTAHLASFNNLNASYSMVADLTGLEYAVNMQYLYADGNSISTLAPLTGLPNLQVLYASDNLLTDLSPVASLYGLTVLYLYDNGITDASPVSGLTGLTYLNLQSNFLTDVSPMAGLEALTFLGVSGNYLTTLAPLVSGTTFTLAANPPELYAGDNPFETDVCDTQIPALETRGVTVSHDACPGSVTIPDVVGMTMLSAGNAIAAAGLTVGMTPEYSSTVPAGYIIRQSPPAGFPVAPGTTVNAVNSLGPEGGVLVNVPDAALADAIRSALSLTPGTPLTTAHLASISYLYADNLGVTDLTGLEWAVNMVSLYLNTSALTGLDPLAGLTGLDTLSCSTCGLSDLSALAGLTQLTFLGLADNQISDLSALAGLTRLESLDLNYNEVADLSPLAGLTALTNLYLSDNQVSDLTALAPMTQLMYLGLGDNLVTDASPLANLSALEMLSLPSNHLTTLAPLVAGTIFTEAVTPGDVYFGDNPFETDVCDTQIPALEARGVTIYHDVCLGSVMNPDIVGLTRIGAGTALGLVGLSVGVVTEVSSETVPAGYVISQDPPAGLPVAPGSSVYFTVSTGPEAGVPVNVPDGGLAGAIRSLLGLPPATPLTTAHLAALTTITINSAGVTDLTGLEYAVNLTNLYAADNALTSAAPLGGLVNLVNVYLGTNLLTDASPLAGMPVITYLDLGNNQLTDTAPLAGLATLQELGLNFNQLTTLAPLVSGTVFTAAAGPPRLYVSGNPFIADVCATQIPALAAAGVTVNSSCP